VASNGKVYKIFDFDEPLNEDNPYIVFQSIYQSKKVKTFHVVYTSKRKITKVVSYSILQFLYDRGELTRPI